VSWYHLRNGWATGAVETVSQKAAYVEVAEEKMRWRILSTSECKELRKGVSCRKLRKTSRLSATSRHAGITVLGDQCRATHARHVRRVSVFSPFCAKPRPVETGKHLPQCPPSRQALLYCALKLTHKFKPSRRIKASSISYLWPGNGTSKACGRWKHTRYHDTFFWTAGCRQRVHYPTHGNISLSMLWA